MEKIKMMNNENVNIIDTKEKLDNITITFNNTQEKMLLDCIRRVRTPFINITVQDVAKDLQVGENMAYEIFKRDDFPSVNIGRKWKISLIAYLLWKTQKRVQKGW